MRLVYINPREPQAEKTALCLCPVSPKTYTLLRMKVLSLLLFVLSGSHAEEIVDDSIDNPEVDIDVSRDKVEGMYCIEPYIYPV